MFERTYYATHPDMMECVSNEELRDRYLIQGLFREGSACSTTPTPTAS
jgi:4-deoxy-L-threo-5-hexosulose-uronate ketol-isomerase